MCSNKMTGKGGVARITLHFKQCLKCKVSEVSERMMC